MWNVPHGPAPGVVLAAEEVLAQHCSACSGAPGTVRCLQQEQGSVGSSEPAPHGEHHRGQQACTTWRAPQGPASLHHMGSTTGASKPAPHGKHHRGQQASTKWGAPQGPSATRMTLCWAPMCPGPRCSAPCITGTTFQTGKLNVPRVAPANTLEPAHLATPDPIKFKPILETMGLRQST